MVKENFNLTGITWITTYDCDLSCRHCFFDTTKTGRYMDPKMVEMVLSELKYTDKMFWQHLSGGEIFLNPDMLFEIISILRKYFDKSIGISTNGNWYGSLERVDNILAKIKDLGVTGICVSADGFHTSDTNIGIQSELVDAIEKAGMNGHSWIVQTMLEKNVHNAEIENPVHKGIADKVKGHTSLPLAPTFVRSIGKGSRVNSPKKERIPHKPCMDMCKCLGTRSPFNPAMVWIDPYGNVMICYGIVIGNVYNQSINQILENYRPDMNEVLESLSSGGTYGMYQLAKKYNKNIPEYYYDGCDLCYTARSALMDVFPQILSPLECYPV